MADLDILQQTLGVSFKDVSLLEQALVHSSYVNENPGLSTASNERLEFLGDAVLGLIVAEKLYQDYPDFNEGEMTRLRAALVRQETLARIAGAINLGSYLYLGKGEEAGGGRQKSANMAAALEAVIAAVFLDRGLARARECVLMLLKVEIEKVISQGKGTDYKSELQHLIQSEKQEPPVYQLIQATGPEHGKTFTIEVRLGETVLGRGEGKSKKAAETEAARVALEKISRGFTV
ncbi:MAG: ribonuclease III [Chloroflexi bacterium RBG_16_51_9]|nr:MAG: ribonuclease III [Chloroflexi bacterium RBG_16_51_9]